MSQIFREENLNIKIGDVVKIKIDHEGRRTRKTKGKIMDITKYFILIKTKEYKECFLKNDIKCNRVKIEVLKKCS
ncbi:MAG: hypothetical protein E6Y49_06440 [Clostridium sporogenes]|nr:hypothetical protein [Clostridium sporogenes]